MHSGNRAASGEAPSGRSLDNRFRYYDPAIGRYVSADPIGQFGLTFAQFGIPSGASGEMSFDGVAANLFAYVWNAPTAFIDPLGLYRCAPGADCTFSPTLDASIECLESCLHEKGRGDDELTVTSGRRGSGSTNHALGQAADFGVNTNPDICPNDFRDCFETCFPTGSYGQREYNASSEPGTHYHVQTNEGRGRTHPPRFAPGIQGHTNHDR